MAQPERESDEGMMWAVSPTELEEHKAAREEARREWSLDHLDLANLSLAPFKEDAGDKKTLGLDLARLLVVWASRYGLDPWAGHVVLEFGKPFVTAQGAIANAQADTRYKGYTVRRATAEEAQAAGWGAGDFVYSCDVLVDGFDEPVRETGQVTQEEILSTRRAFGPKADFLPVVKTPWHVARARAIRRAHLRAVPLRARAGPS